MRASSSMWSDGRIRFPRVVTVAVLLAVAISVPALMGRRREVRMGGAAWPRWSGMGFLLPVASRLMRPVVPSGATASQQPRHQPVPGRAVRKCEHDVRGCRVQLERRIAPADPAQTDLSDGGMLPKPCRAREVRCVV